MDDSPTSISTDSTSPQASESPNTRSSWRDVQRDIGILCTEEGLVPSTLFVTHSKCGDPDIENVLVDENHDKDPENVLVDETLDKDPENASIADTLTNFEVDTNWDPDDNDAASEETFGRVTIRHDWMDKVLMNRRVVEECEKGVSIENEEKVRCLEAGDWDGQNVQEV